MNVHPSKQPSQQRRLQLEQQSIILDAKLEQLQQAKQAIELELQSLPQAEESTSLQAPPLPELHLSPDSSSTVFISHE